MRGGGYTHVMRGRSRMTINPRIPTMPGRSTSGFRGVEFMLTSCWKVLCCVVSLDVVCVVLCRLMSVAMRNNKDSKNVDRSIRFPSLPLRILRFFPRVLFWPLGRSVVSYRLASPHLAFTSAYCLSPFFLRFLPSSPSAFAFCLRLLPFACCLSPFAFGETGEPTWDQCRAS